MKVLFTILASALAFAISAQDIVKIKSFTSLIISRGVDVRLVKSQDKEVKIEVKGIDFDDVIIEQEDDELSIKIASKSLWQEMEDHHWWARVTLPYQEISNLEVTTGAKLSSTEVVQGKDIDMQVSMGGEVELSVAFDEIIIDASMGSLTEFSGNVNNLNISASMGAEVDFSDLAAETAFVKSSMGSVVIIMVSKEFEGKASMGGKINVSGNPDKYYENITMGGEITLKK